MGTESKLTAVAALPGLYGDDLSVGIISQTVEGKVQITHLPRHYCDMGLRKTKISKS